MSNKKYYQSLIGSKVIDKRKIRIGYINNISFLSKDFKICWFNFKYEKGAYLVHIDELTIIKSLQLTLDL
jgi:sporulation protein YlmC with PRC-barrel domain